MCQTWLELVLKSKLCTFLPNSTFGNVTLVAWIDYEKVFFITRIANVKISPGFTTKSVKSLYWLSYFESGSYYLQSKQISLRCLLFQISQESWEWGSVPYSNIHKINYLRENSCKYSMLITVIMRVLSGEWGRWHLSCKFCFAILFI